MLQLKERGISKKCIFGGVWGVGALKNKRYMLSLNRLFYTGLRSRKALDSVFLGYFSVSNSVDHLFHFLRNAFSRKSRTKQRCESTGLATFASITATTAAGDGISPSTVQSARLRPPLMVWCTWCMELAAD